MKKFMKFFKENETLFLLGMCIVVLVGWIIVRFFVTPPKTVEVTLFDRAIYFCGGVNKIDRYRESYNFLWLGRDAWVKCTDGRGNESVSDITKTIVADNIIKNKTLNAFTIEGTK